MLDKKSDYRERMRKEIKEMMTIVQTDEVDELTCKCGRKFKMNSPRHIPENHSCVCGCLTWYNHQTGEDIQEERLDIC